MPVEVRHSPPPLHRPGDVTARPKGILKNPSFSGPSGQHSPTKELNEAGTPNLPPSATLDPQEAKEITIQNTIQNAGHRRSSSAARRQSATRRHSSTASKPGASESIDESEDPDKMRLKWDEANLFLAEQEKGGRMKITEPKTPYQYGSGMDEEEDDDDVAIDPRFVNVDEVDMAAAKKAKNNKKARESDIPGLDIGEPEEEMAGVGAEDERIVRGGSMSRENSKDKHVSVSGDTEGSGFAEGVGLPTREEQEKHRKFEEMRKKHYEMKDVKGMLGHPEAMDEDEDEAQSPRSTALPNRGANGA